MSTTRTEVLFDSLDLNAGAVKGKKTFFSGKQGVDKTPAQANWAEPLSAGVTAQLHQLSIFVAGNKGKGIDASVIELLSLPDATVTIKQKSNPVFTAPLAFFPINFGVNGLTQATAANSADGNGWSGRFNLPSSAPLTVSTGEAFELEIDFGDGATIATGGSGTRLYLAWTAVVTRQ